MRMIVKILEWFGFGVRSTVSDFSGYYLRVLDQHWLYRCDRGLYKIYRNHATDCFYILVYRKQSSNTTQHSLKLLELFDCRFKEVIPVVDIIYSGKVKVISKDDLFLGDKMRKDNV